MESRSVFHAETQAKLFSIESPPRSLEAAGAVVIEVSVPMHLDASHIWTAVGLEGIVSAQFQGGGHGYNTTSTSPGAPALCQSWAEGLAASADELSQTNKAWGLAGQHVMQQGPNSVEFFWFDFRLEKPIEIPF